mgnify:CR=1 FL=1
MSPNRKRSKLSILLELFFDTSLLILFVVQAFILGCLLTYGYIPIPKDWASQQIATYLPSEFRVEADTIRLKLNGEIELSNIAAWTDTIQQPVLQSDGAVLHLKFDKENQYKPYVESLVISNGTLFLPAVYSPDGLRRPILEKTAFRLIPGPDVFRIDSFAALHETIRLRGSFEWPKKPNRQQNGKSIHETVRNFYNYSSTAIKERNRFDVFVTPTFFFHLTTNPDESLKLTTTLSSRKLKHPYATGSNFKARSVFKIKGDQLLAESDLHVDARNIELPSLSMSGSGLNAVIAKANWQSLLQGKLPELHLLATNFSIYEFDLVAPVLKLQTETYPEIRLSGATSGLKGAVTFNALINTDKKAGQVDARGSVDLVSLIPEELTTSIPSLEFEQAPYYDLQLTFSDGFTLESASLKADAYAVSIDGLTFDHISAKATFKDKLYSLENVYMQRDWQWVDLNFSLNARTWDYKVTLLGSAVPYDYNNLLPRWWAGIFKDFDFSQTLGNYGDFIIYGNSKQSVSDLYYGHVSAKKVSYKDVMIDDATLLVRGRGRYAEVAEIDAVSNGGWAKGDLAFSSLPDDINAPVSVRMKFDAQLRLEDAKKLFGSNIASILDDFETNQLPTTKLEGALFNNAYTKYSDKNYFNLRARSNGPIKFKDVPLDYLQFDLYGKENVTHLRNIQFGFADGTGRAEADITQSSNSAPSLNYTVKLENADQRKAINSLPQLDSVENDLTNESPKTAPAEQGTLNFSLHAKGPANNPYQHNGYGSFVIKNKNLGSIQLLGPLSRLLKNTKFSFTSFNLDTMSSSFALDDNLLKFENLQINGPRTRIQAPGTMTLKEQSLDMRVTVNLFANLGSSDSTLKKVGNIITKPIPNLLAFDLSGTVKEQKWRSTYDPRNLIPIF